MSKLLWQITKYGLIGILATAINVAVAEFLAATVWPCLGGGDPLVRFAGFAPSDVADAVRATRAVGCNIVGFFAANVVCWLLNRRYVFTPGRHAPILEYLLFLAGSGFAVLVGNFAIWALVRYAGVETTYSFLINVLVSVAVNFLVRKFIVFKD